MIFGGSAGGGKTYSILLECCYHVHVPGFTATIFRKTYPQITKQGGLLDESMEVFRGLRPPPTLNFGMPGWRFPSGAEVRFSHLDEHTYTIDNQGAQICLICFDQLEQFSEEQFFYMQSRNRSMCGVKPYIRGTANPQPGWLAELLAWWIDEDGYANLSRGGVKRWFIRDMNQLVWADDPADLKARNPKCKPKSLTFIPSTIYDNPKLLEQNPGYLASLMALPDLERERLLGDPKRGGNWKIRAGGSHFKREWFKPLPQKPAGLTYTRRYWDLAATPPSIVEGTGNKDPDSTVGALLGYKDGCWYICDVIRGRWSPQSVRNMVWQAAVLDGPEVPVRMEIEGGSSGKTVVDMYARDVFPGRDFRGCRPVTSKAIRAQPLSAAAEAGNVYIVAGPWNKAFLDEAESFTGDGAAGTHDDQIDAISGAMDDIRQSIGGGMVHIGGAQGPLENVRKTLDEQIRKQYNSIHDPAEKLKAAEALQKAGFTI